MANRIVLNNNNENYNEPEYEPEFEHESEYDPEYEEIETVEDSEKITFRVKISNGYDVVEFDTTNFSTALNYMGVFKQKIQKLQDYVSVPQGNTQPVQQPVKQGTASPKQRQILLRHGYTEAQIDAMGQKEAADAIKEIFSSKN